MRIGSIFSGGGGLDLAALALFPGASIAWHAEVDPAASKVLAHHWPATPNLGDVTAIDWASVEPIDILIGGFPCQDVSSAGRRAGLAAGTRSGLWSHMRAAIEVLRPRWVLIENVRGLLSARAIRTVESGTDAVGDDGGRPVLRALGAVLGDLADLRFHAEWACVRASDVGAAHRRERVFILAHPADPHSFSGRRSAGTGGEGGRSTEAQAARALADPPRVGWEGVDDSGFSATARRGRDGELGRGAGGTAAPDADRAGRQGREPAVAHRRGGPAGRGGGPVELLPTPRASDGSKGGPNQRGSSGELMLPSAVALLPTPAARLGNSRGATHPDRRRELNAKHSPELDEVAAHLLPTPRTTDANGAGRHGTGGLDLRTAVTQWGPYTAAIRRQEALSRPAPPATEPNRYGNPRLSPAFVEWLMWWPDGWVTDPVIGLSRTEQLRICGNGVIPPQAVAAFGHLLAISLEGTAS